MVCGDSQPSWYWPKGNLGYGSTSAVVAKFMDKLGIKDALETWDDAMIRKVVDGFLDERFPTVVALNKIDMADADKNITKIMRKYDPVRIYMFLLFWQ